jgi:hypothetical protein
MPSEQAFQSRHSRVHRGHRIVAVQLGDGWVGTVYGPGSNGIVGNVEGASPQEVMIRGVGTVNDLLAAADRG